MKLDKNGWLIRFAYGYDVPTVVTVCGLFWKTVWMMTIYSFIFGMPLWAFYSIGLAGTFWFFVTIAAIFGTLWLASFVMTTGRKQRQRQPSLLWAYIKAKKDRYCPIIELE